jgi:large subunit ribosomal protein L16
MNIPKKSKFRKFQKKSFLHRTALSGFVKTQRVEGFRALDFGEFAIKAQGAGLLSSQIIESFRRTLTRNFQRKGKIWIRVFPHIAITKKPLEVRMGKGKGNPKGWVAPVRTGQILFEMSGVQSELVKKSFVALQRRSPIRLSLVQP